MVQCHVDNVFLRWTWYQQKSGDIRKRLHSLWCKPGIFADAPPAKNIACNIIRKSASTGLRESEISTGELQESTDLMILSAQTAEKHYFIRKRENCFKSWRYNTFPLLPASVTTCYPSKV